MPLRCASGRSDKSEQTEDGGGFDTFNAKVHGNSFMARNKRDPSFRGTRIGGYLPNPEIEIIAPVSPLVKTLSAPRGFEAFVFPPAAPDAPAGLEVTAHGPGPLERGSDDSGDADTMTAGLLLQAPSCPSVGFRARATSRSVTPTSGSLSATSWSAGAASQSKGMALASGLQPLLPPSIAPALPNVRVRHR